MDAFLAKQIHAPIHLSSPSQVDALIDIFHAVRPQDWVFSTWRSHYHCLLKGVPEEEVFQAILDGRSMYLNFPEYKVVASSIVGGILPIALGMAMGAKRKGLDEQVWVFVGDMAATTGVFHEFAQYAQGHALPLHTVVEDNGYSTNTPTGLVWGQHEIPIPIERYSYERTFPHTGVGAWVTFG